MIVDIYIYIYHAPVVLVGVSEQGATCAVEGCAIGDCCVTNVWTVGAVACSGTGGTRAMLDYGTMRRSRSMCRAGT